MLTSDFNSQTVPDLFLEAAVAIDKALEEKKVDRLVEAMEAVLAAETKLSDAEKAAANVASEVKNERLDLIRKKIAQALALKTRIFQAYDEIPAEDANQPNAREFFQTAAARRK